MLSIQNSEFRIPNSEFDTPSQAKHTRSHYSPAKKAAVAGLMAALTLALSFVERMLCAALPLPPGVRPGLSNVAVMFSCIALGLPFALAIILIKAGFVMLISGVYAGIISVSGGVLSVLSVALLARFARKKLSFTGISVVSAVLHNFGQLTAASLLVGSALYLWMAPVLLISGVVFGAVTGMLLNAVLPALLKIVPFIEKE